MPRSLFSWILLNYHLLASYVFLQALPVVIHYMFPHTSSFGEFKFTVFWLVLFIFLPARDAACTPCQISINRFDFWTDFPWLRTLHSRASCRCVAARAVHTLNEPPPPQPFFKVHLLHSSSVILAILDF